MSTKPQFRVASDVGGTFTDSIAYNVQTRTISVSKVSTTPANRALGTAAGLRQALALQRATGAEVVYVGHGMTTATNAVIQRTGARTAFLTNYGFKDLLTIGRQNRPSLFDISVVRPEELVPRDLCYTARGRITAEGTEIAPLSGDDVRAAAVQMLADGVQSVAILFLHSYANPCHELRAKEILQEALPGVPVCASTDLAAEFREFERASTTVLNAYLRPVMETYLQSLSGILEDAEAGLGLPLVCPVMVMDAAGGLMSLKSAREKPVHTVLSGPAGGVVAAAHVSGLSGVLDIITMDIGGTSTDISLIRNGRPEITRSASLESVPVQLPVIDINAIGAGGGSIAWIDEGGALRVGPMSAEAMPGPACYNRGGDNPTVTDANLVLGRFDANSRLGGELALDLEAAQRAVQRKIATPLGLSVEEAAAGILRVAHANIVRGIRVVSVERGYDPRDFALVPFGGAGPMHGSPVARELRMPKVLIPPTPGILCAMGQLISDLRHDFIKTHIAAYGELGAEGVALLIAALVAQAQDALAKDGVSPEQRDIEIRIDLRYLGQSYALPILTDPACPGWWDALPDAFNEAHKARFGHSEPSSPLQVVGFNVTGIGRIEKPSLPDLASGTVLPECAARLGARNIYFEGAESGGAGRWHSAEIWDRAALLADNVIEGPAAVVEVSATTILYPGDRLTVDPSGNLIVEVGL